MTPSAIALLIVLSGLDVRGTSTCPTPEAVEERVAGIAPRLLSAQGSLDAELSPVDGGVRVKLYGADGQELTERLISGDGDCEALAAATGVILVAWAAEFEDASRPAAPPHPQMPGEDLQGAAPERLPLSRDAETWTVEVDVAAGLSASIATGAVAMGGLLTGGMTSRRHDVGGQVTIAALGARTEAGATTTWERFALAAGPHYRFDFSAVDVDVHAGAVGALLSVIPGDDGGARTAFDPGAAFGLRVLSGRGLWGGAQALGWFVPRTLPQGSPLPRFEVLITGGLAWTHP